MAVTNTAPQPSGSGGAIMNVGSAGDDRIDALLSGVKWSGPSISYSDPDALADYQTGYFSDADKDTVSAQDEGWSELSKMQRVAVHFALDAFTQPPAAAPFSVEGFTNLDITYAGAGAATGTIRLANTTDTDTSYAYQPSEDIYGGDVWLGLSVSAPLAGNFGWYSTLRSIGRALGLKPGHDTGVLGALPAAYDSMEFSVMTDRSFVGDTTVGGFDNAFGSFAQTFMMLDIAGLQHMYGADYGANSGNTLYTWDPDSGEAMVNGTLAIPGGDRIFATIWDGGGIDTYDLSNYRTDLTIDLHPGSYSVFDPAQLANLGGGSNGGYARGNVFNALLFGGDTHSLIENAIGAIGNDYIQGNQGKNTLSGNSGKDTLIGGAGNDTLRGGDGGDELYGDFAALAVGLGSGYASLDARAGNGSFLTAHDLTRNFTLAADSDVDGATTISHTTLNAVGSNAAAYSKLSVPSRSELTIDIDHASPGFDSYVRLFDAARGLVAVNDDGSGDAGSTSSTDSLLVQTVEAGTYYVVIGRFDNPDSIGAGSTYELNVSARATALTEGGAGNDFLDGDGGADTMIGGAGNDTYVVTQFDYSKGPTLLRLEGELDSHIFIGSRLFTPDNGTFTVSLSDHSGDGVVDYLRLAYADHSGPSWWYLDVSTAALGHGLRPGYYPDAQRAALAEEGHAGFDVFGNGNGSSQVFASFTIHEAVIDYTDTGPVLRRFAIDFLHHSESPTSPAVAGAFNYNATRGRIVPETVVERPGEGTDTVRTSIDYTLPAHVENVTGSNAGNKLTGNSIANVMDGGSGADILRGLDGADRLRGGSDSDTLEGGGGNDTLEGGDGGDRLQGGPGFDMLDGGANADYANYAIAAGAVTVNLTTPAGNRGEAAGDSFVAVEGIIGSRFGDTLVGDKGANSISGGNGNDLLAGRGGSDILLGQGNDDTLEGGTGGDTLDGGGAVDLASYRASASGVQASLSSPSGNTGDAAGDSYLSIEGLLGSAFNDTLTGDDRPNVLRGGNGNDSLEGGPGGDLLDGGANIDTASYVSAADSVTVDLTAPSLNRGEAEGDTLTLVERLLGSAFGDRLSGDAKANAIFAGSGNDTLLGRGGNDNLQGQAGDDTIDGGSGTDVYGGGTGNDDFVFYAGQANGDSVLDFKGDGALAGDELLFHDYGPGATFEKTSATLWSVHYGNAVETITFANGAPIDASDFRFV